MHKEGYDSVLEIVGLSAKPWRIIRCFGAFGQEKIQKGR